MDTAAVSAKVGRPPNDDLTRQQREDEILDAAIQLFAAHGFAEATTQAVADAIKVGKGTIYRYFATKRELFLAAVDRVMRRLTAAVDKAVSVVADEIERMPAAIEAYLTFFREHPEYVELLIQERANFKDRKKPTYFEHQDANAERHNVVIRTLIAAGRIRALPPERITEVLSDMIYGTMFTNYFARRDTAPAEQARALSDIAMLGILSDSERRRRLEQSH